ncbi:hypothetical protein Acr_09g0006020 [Actinidia rufa]|uniref:Uncharacterized protein n=1 Tax=Actinidia rufa TaxID=165716 RepID=A0A7J0F6U1_9ERIC|nr:hypothetical protein Acr_09g0006020 [Actinidia rufa]
MSSIGASFASVYLQQKRQEEKLKKMEGKERSGEAGGEAISSKRGKSKKIHPGTSPLLSSSVGSSAEKLGS